MKTLYTTPLTAGLLICATLENVTFACANEVNIYSYRQPELIKPLTDAFTKQTGIKTNLLFLNKGLIARVKAEATGSPVDVLLTVDIGRLQGAEDANITQPISSEKITATIPAQYRDPDNNWFGVTTRARVVYASNVRVAQDSITYEELADPKWKGKICIRDGQHSYNIALFASMISHLGEEKAAEWMTGFKNNLARKPAGNDRAQAKSIFSGECDLGIGNSYYVGLMQTNEKKPEQKEWAKAIKVLFPNNDGRGAHVNISGMALAKHAPNKANGIKFMEFLASARGQQIYGLQVYEYPVADGVEASELVKTFGDLKPDTLLISEIAKHRKRASELVDETGFNNGPSN